LKTPLADNGNIKVPAKMSIYREMKIDATDKYIVETAGLVEESNVLLVNEQQALCAILTLQKDKQQPNRYYFVTDTAMNMQNTKNKNYSFIFLRKQDSDYLYKTYYQEVPQPPTNSH